MFKNTTISNFNQELNTAIRAVSSLIEKSWGRLIANKRRTIEYRSAYTPIIHALLNVAIQDAKEDPKRFVSRLENISPEYFDFIDDSTKFEFVKQLSETLEEWKCSPIYKKFEKRIIKRNKSKHLSIDKILSMEKRGASKTEVADYFGVSRTTIRDFKRRQEKT